LRVGVDTRPLAATPYRRLWASTIVTSVSSQLTEVAIPLQVFQVTGSSAYVGLAGAFGLVPLVVFGLWGGAVADAVDRRRMALVTNAGIALTSTALWVQAALRSLSAGAVVAGLCSGAFTRLRRHGVMVVASVCAWGLAVVGHGLSRRLWLAVVFLGLGGAALFVLAVFRGTILQAAASDEMRGRMQGALGWSPPAARGSPTSSTGPSARPGARPWRSPAAVSSPSRRCSLWPRRSRRCGATGRAISMRGGVGRPDGRERGAAWA
jgi:MFS family permease